MEFWGVFDFASTFSPHLSLRVGTVNRFNRPVVFIHAQLACCVHGLCLKLFR